MRRTAIIICFLISIVPICSGTSLCERLRAQIEDFTSGKSGEIGVAVILGNGDTLSVNNRPVYPMMSVFKLHQAIATCGLIEKNGTDMDSVLTLARPELCADTWSPMLTSNNEDTLRLSIRKLLEYSLIESDNNASNVLFDKFGGVGAAMRFLRGIRPDGGFNIEFTEAEMHEDHSRCYSNYSSPMSCAKLIRSLFEGNAAHGSLRTFITESMKACKTGEKRIKAGLPEGAELYHKTGSGYVNGDGVLVALNDAGYIRMRDGRSLVLAVFIKDFSGSADAAESIIAEISRMVCGEVLQQEL